MGRWLKKSREMHNSELTKPTEPSFVSLVSTLSGPFENAALSPGYDDHELQLVELQNDPLAGLDLLPGDQGFIDDLLNFTSSQQRLSN